MNNEFEILSKIIENRRSIFPVSYTHLDVYKRQAPSGARGISLFIVPKFLKDASGNYTIRNDAGPVSYTHLDVYKRQILRNTKIRTFKITMRRKPNRMFGAKGINSSAIKCYD